MSSERLVPLGDKQGMVREGFPEEVAFEEGEEQGCAFQGLEWPIKRQRAVKDEGLPGNGA